MAVNTNKKKHVKKKIYNVNVFELCGSLWELFQEKRLSHVDKFRNVHQSYMRNVHSSFTMFEPAHPARKQYLSTCCISYLNYILTDQQTMVLGHLLRIFVLLYLSHCRSFPLQTTLRREGLISQRDPVLQRLHQDKIGWDIDCLKWTEKSHSGCFLLMSDFAVPLEVAGKEAGISLTCILKMTFCFSRLFLLRSDSAVCVEGKDRLSARESPSNLLLALRVKRRQHPLLFFWGLGCAGFRQAEVAKQRPASVPVVTKVKCRHISPCFFPRFVLAVHVEKAQVERKVRQIPECYSLVLTMHFAGKLKRQGRLIVKSQLV